MLASCARQCHVMTCSVECVQCLCMGGVLGILPMVAFVPLEAANCTSSTGRAALVQAPTHVISLDCFMRALLRWVHFSGAIIDPGSKS